MKILKEVETARGRLRYYLTESVRSDGIIVYGVKSVTTLFGEREEASVPDISSNKETAERFVELIADNIVLPSTLAEIAEEYISAKTTV